jgi:hypothetical protein
MVGMRYAIYILLIEGEKKMERIVMNLDELWVEVFPKLRGDTHAGNIISRMKTEEKISLMAKEIRRLHADLSRENAGRKRRDRELDRLRQLEIIHTALNDCGGLL